MTAAVASGEEVHLFDQSNGEEKRIFKTTKAEIEMHGKWRGPESKLELENLTTAALRHAKDLHGGAPTISHIRVQPYDPSFRLCYLIFDFEDGPRKLSPIVLFPDGTRVISQVEPAGKIEPPREFEKGR